MVSVNMRLNQTEQFGIIHVRLAGWADWLVCENIWIYSCVCPCIVCGVGIPWRCAICYSIHFWNGCFQRVLVARALMAYLMCRFNQTKRMIIRPTIPTGGSVGRSSKTLQAILTWIPYTKFWSNENIALPVDTQNFCPFNLLHFI